MSNPVLIELTRGKLVESVHRGAIAVARPGGELVVSLGDVDRPVYPRSAIKALQCLPLIETGAADRFELGPAEIALACASHSGTDRHVAVAGTMLRRAGRKVSDLGCGAHEPLGEAALRAFLGRGEQATALHNNCSGKHAGMVCTACHNGESVEGYLDAGHPVQGRIIAVMEAFTGQPIGRDAIGFDGCSAPNFAQSLASLARAFAAFGAIEGPGKARRAAIERILAACWAEPEMVAGPGRLDTLVMRKFPRRIFIKTGAEGVYCGALPELGLGIALKIDDGARRAAEAALLEVVDRLVPGATAAGGGTRAITNWRGMEVGEMRAAADLARAVDGLQA